MCTNFHPTTLQRWFFFRLAPRASRTRPQLLFTLITARRAFRRAHEAASTPVLAAMGEQEVLDHLYKEAVDCCGRARGLYASIAPRLSSSLPLAGVGSAADFKSRGVPREGKGNGGGVAGKRRGRGGSDAGRHTGGKSARGQQAFGHEMASRASPAVALQRNGPQGAAGSAQPNEAEGGRGRQSAAGDASAITGDAVMQLAPDLEWRHDRRRIVLFQERWDGLAAAAGLMSLAATLAQNEVLFRTGGLDPDYGPLGPVLDIRGIGVCVCAPFVCVCVRALTMDRWGSGIVDLLKAVTLLLNLASLGAVYRARWAGHLLRTLLRHTRENTFYDPRLGPRSVLSSTGFMLEALIIMACLPPGVTFEVGGGCHGCRCGLQRRAARVPHRPPH